MSNTRPKHPTANCGQTASPMLPPGDYKRGVGWTWHRDSAFCQITLFLVIAFRSKYCGRMQTYQSAGRRRLSSVIITAAPRWRCGSTCCHVYIAPTTSTHATTSSTTTPTGRPSTPAAHGSPRAPSWPCYGHWQLRAQSEATTRCRQQPALRRRRLLPDDADAPRPRRARRYRPQRPRPGRHHPSRRVGHGHRRSGRRPRV